MYVAQEMRRYGSRQLRREVHIDQDICCAGCDNNVTSDGISDITQHKIAGGTATRASLWRMSVEYLEQILYTLSVLTYWRRSQVGIVETLRGFNILVETDYSAQHQLHGRVQ